MKTLNSSLAALALSITSMPATAAHLQAHTLFSAKLNGAQQVPVNSSPALGLGGLTLNATRDTLCVNIGWTGLSSPLTGLHIHDGVAGTNGPVLIDLVPFIQGDHVMTTLTGASLTSELVAKHLRGELYLNIHTENNPNGEIRGQIFPETDFAYVADLNGAQQVPAVSTSAFGLGTFLLARHNGSLKFNVVVNGLSGPITAAHFHSGEAGTAGGVVQDLGAFVTGNAIAGVVDPAVFLADLQAGNIYINIHTDANPNGEIRGQLMMPDGLAFDASLNGAQQTPPVITDAKGAASLIATWDLDSIWYDVVLNGLSGPIQAAHLHNGALGASGPVVIDIGGGINGNRINGWITGVAQADAIKLLEGNLYVNVHTEANPDGEVRGQVYRYMREGYTISLDGTQEVPMVTTTGSGAGIVSVDRGQSNAHIMFVVTPPLVQAAHFHNGVAGTNGPVLFDMSDLILSNGVFTYWKSTDATPFTTANSIQFRNDSLYLNVHTEDYPNGEVRGQVRRGAVCSDLNIGLEEGGRNTGTFSVWPVPATQQLSITFPTGIASNGTIEVLNATGALVYNANLGTRANSMNMDVTTLPTGLYFLRISAGDQVYTERFTKE